MPNFNTLRAVPEFMRIFNTPPAQHQHQPQLQQQEMLMRQQQLLQQPQLPQQPQQQQQQPQPPQQQQPQQQPMPSGASNFYPRHSPLPSQQPYSPTDSVNTNSPQQMVPDVSIYSPPHSAYQMMSPPHNDPNLASTGAGHSVDEVFSGYQVNQVPMAPSTSTSAGMAQQPNYMYQPPIMDVSSPLGMSDQSETVTASLMSDEDLNALMNHLPPGALEGDSLTPDHNRGHRAPRGMVRGIGGPAGPVRPAAAADSAPAPASGQLSGDQLAEDLGKMSLGGGGGGRRGSGGGGGGGGPGGQDMPRAADTSRPEVQLAYVNADSLYLFAATGDENFLLERFRCLVGMENYDGDNALHVAAMYQSTKALSGLLEAISGLTEDLRLTMVDSPNANRQTPLHLAVLKGDLECVQLLLQAGAQSHLVDQSGNTALHLAARAGSGGVVSTLLQQLRQGGQAERLLQQTNYRGLSPLHVAVQAGQQQAAKLLCEAGADVSAADDTEGRSPLHLAVQARDVAMCRLLLRQGAVVDALTFGDVTPLHVACKLGDRRLVSLLVSKGADPRRQSVERQPAAGSGTESGDDEPEEQEGADDDEEDNKLDAFLYAEMAGDPTLDQILRGRLQLPADEEAEEDQQQQQQQPQQPPPQLAAAAAVPPAAVAAAKKGDMDSGMDSGLGITQELSSAFELSSAADLTGATGGPASDADSLPDSAVLRLCSLLDGDGGAWRTVAELLELDAETGKQHSSPTVYILRCVKKYDNLSLDYLARVLGTLGLTEAQRVVLQHTGQ